jgi:hypothetical protein
MFCSISMVHFGEYLVRASANEMMLHFGSNSSTIEYKCCSSHCALEDTEITDKLKLRSVFSEDSSFVTTGSVSVLLLCFKRIQIETNGALYPGYQMRWVRHAKLGTTRAYTTRQGLRGTLTESTLDPCQARHLSCSRG